MKTKVCNTCKQELPVAAFYKLPSGNPRRECKKCFCIYKEEVRQLKMQGKRKCKRCEEIKSTNDFGIGRKYCNACRVARGENIEADERMRALPSNYDWEDEYKRVLRNTPLEKGIGNVPFNFELKKDEKYKIISPSKTKVGKVIQTTDDFFVLESDRKIRECFRYNDYKLGEYKIERV